MKKIISVILVLVMALSMLALVACEKEPAETPDVPADNADENAG